MEEVLKNRVILALSILTVIFLIIGASSCVAASNSRRELQKEKAASWDMEQKANKFTQEKALLDKKLSELAKAIESEKSLHEATKKALAQEQMVNNSLKEELKKVTKLKEALEEDLKEALTAAKAARPK